MELIEPRNRGFSKAGISIGGLGVVTGILTSKTVEPLPTFGFVAVKIVIKYDRPSMSLSVSGFVKATVSSLSVRVVVKSPWSP